MGLAYVCLCLCVCMEGVFPRTQSGKTSIFEDGCAVRLSRSADVSALLDGDFGLC